MSFTEGMSPADLSAVMGNNDGFGNGGAWWIILLFLILGRGWGYGDNQGGSSVKDQYVLSSDFATIQRQLSDGFGALEAKGDSISNGLCSGFYETARIGDGINTNILTTGNAMQIATMQGFNAVQSQLAQCCCDNRAAIADIKYADAMNTNNITNAVNTGFCQTNFNAQNNTRDIVDSQNAGFQAVMARIDALESHRKDEKIAEQAQQISALQLAASQAAQNNYLVNQLRPCPVPAYITCNPFAASYGCGNTCNCN